MKVKVDSKENIVKLIPETDIDLFQLGWVFGNGLSNIMTIAEGKIQLVSVKAEDLWKYVFESVKKGK